MHGFVRNRAESGLCSMTTSMYVRPTYQHHMEVQVKYTEHKLFWEFQMEIICSILIILLGLFLVIKPDWVYYISESWKSNFNSEPSNLYLVSTKIGGLIVLIIGLVLLILSLFAQ